VEARDGARLLPAPGVGTNRLVRFLIEHGRAVHEITPEQTTLEQFYLGLMEREKEAKP
jgi:hypothetical protein